jgi:4-cresol dehydrogenase (hydroxylating)
LAYNTPLWRSKRAIPKEASEELLYQGGLIWFACAVPATRQCITEFRSIVTRVLNEYRFDCCMSLIAINPRVFAVPLPILFDPDSEEDRLNAITCHQQLHRQCAEAGYLPYRGGVQSMGMIVNSDDVFWKVVQSFKRAIDPNEIIAPGRYNL